MAEAEAAEAPTPRRSRARSKAPRDPEGRMPLAAHLVELRNRAVVSAIALLIGTIAGWFLFDFTMNFLEYPFRVAQERGFESAQINYGTALSPFDMHLRLAAFVGVVLASPILIYETWMYLMPGLKKNEKRYAVGFLIPAVPLFIAGCMLGYWMMTKAIPILMEFGAVSDVTSNIMDGSLYMRLMMRTTLLFGVVFLLPLGMVAMNLVGVVRASQLLKAWRWVILISFVFCAMMVPTPDPYLMSATALMISSLFFAAVGVCALNDRRRDRRAAKTGDLDDEEASGLDGPEDVAGASSLDEDDGLGDSADPGSQQDRA